MVCDWAGFASELISVRVNAITHLERSKAEIKTHVH